MNSIFIALALLPFAILFSFIAYRAIARRRGNDTSALTMLYHCCVVCTGLFLLVVVRAFSNGEFAKLERDDGVVYEELKPHVRPLPGK